jgi:signal transduction histidine kinase
MLEESTVDAQLYQRIRTEALRFTTLAANAPCTVEAAFHEQHRDVLIRAVPFCDAQQQRAGTIIDVADITELRGAQRERNDVLRFLSHDMRSPASSLLGLAQLQRDPNRALPANELSQQLDLLAQRLLTLVDGFVSLSRAESIDPRIFEEFDLQDAVQDAYDEVWAAAQARENEIRLTANEESLLVQGDRQAVARAIVNLLSNALKFSSSGAPVELHCQREGSAAVVRVLDQGRGIDPERLQTLFRRFSRGAHRGEMDPGGAGLGLAFVRVVADKHGGSAWATNRLHQGAAFCLSLPTVNRASTVTVES